MKEKKTEFGALTEYRVIVFLSDGSTKGHKIFAGDRDTAVAMAKGVTCNIGCLFVRLEDEAGNFIWSSNRETLNEGLYRLVGWPEIQDFMDHDRFGDCVFCQQIDGHPCDDSTYAVPVNLYEDVYGC